MNNLEAAQRYGLSIWLDYIRRDLITTGKLKELVAKGLCGLISNPTIFEKAIASSKDYDNAIRKIVREKPGIDTESLYEYLAIEDIQMAADILRPVCDKTDGLDGLASLEASPYLAYDTQGTIKEVRRLWRLVGRPNVMIKVPATQQGIDAIELLLAEKININVTLMFSLRHYEAELGINMDVITGRLQKDGIKAFADSFSKLLNSLKRKHEQELEK